MEKPDIVNLLKDKTGLIEYLASTILSADKITDGLYKMKERGFSTNGMLEKVIEVTALQSQQLKHIALVALILAQSEKFDIIVAQMMVNMGRGEEALQKMFEKKFRGE